MVEGLKACPFCGGEAALVEGHADHWRAACTHCCATSQPTWFAREGAKSKAADAWNTRLSELTKPTRTEAAEVLGRINRAANAILASDVECMSATIENVVRDIAALSASIPTGSGRINDAAEFLRGLEPIRITDVRGNPGLVYSGQNVIDAFKAGAALTPTASDSGEVTGAEPEPVAWMYHHPGDPEHGWQRYKFERRIQSYEGMSCNEEDAGVIETPLYTLEAFRDRLAHTTAEPTEREAWKPIEDAPHACHVLAARFDWDAGEWACAVVLSPPIQPFTIWRMLPDFPLPTRPALTKDGE